MTPPDRVFLTKVFDFNILLIKSYNSKQNRNLLQFSFEEKSWYMCEFNLLVDKTVPEL